MNIDAHTFLITFTCLTIIYAVFIKDSDVN